MRKIAFFLFASLLLNLSPYAQNCAASFTYSTGAGGQLNLTSTSTGTTSATQYWWYVGNGNVLSNAGPNVSYTYPYDGTYHVRLWIQDSGFVSSCSDSTSFDIPITNSPNAPCLSANFTYTVSAGTVYCTLTNPTAYTYWSFGDGSSASNTSNASHAYSQNGNYSIVCMTLYNYSGNIFLTCDTVVQSVQVSGVPCVSQFHVDSSSLNNHIIIYNQAQGCDSLFYSVDGGPHMATYPFWPDTIWNLSAGNHTICQYITGTSCTDSSCQTIMVNCGINVTYNVGCSQVTCTSTSNQSITSASWSIGGTVVSTQVNPVISFTNTSSFYVTYNLQAALCQKTDSFFVQVGPQPMFYLSPDSVNGPHNWLVYVNNQANYTSYLWNWGDGTTSTGAFPSHSYSAPGWYTICLTVTDNCGMTGQYCQNDSLYRASSTMIGMTVVPQNAGVGVQQIAKNELKAYPVPASDRLFLESLPLHSDLLLFDNEGRLVLREQNGGKESLSISVKDLNPGFYILKINSSEGSIQKKIVKE